MKHANIGLVTDRPVITKDEGLIEKLGAIVFFNEELLRRLDTLYVLGTAIESASADLLAIQNIRCV